MQVSQIQGDKVKHSYQTVYLKKMVKAMNLINNMYLVNKAGDLIDSRGGYQLKGGDLCEAIE